MKQPEVINKLHKDIEDISAKYDNLKDTFSESTNEEFNNHIQSVLNRLTKLNKEIHEYYSELLSTKSENESEMSVIEKNIYISIESFNSTYAKTGLLFN